MSIRPLFRSLFLSLCLILAGSVLWGGCHLLFPFNPEQTDPPDAAAPLDAAAADHGDDPDGLQQDGTAVHDGPKDGIVALDSPPVDALPPPGDASIPDGSTVDAKLDTAATDSGTCPPACVWGCDSVNKCVGFWPSNTNSATLAAVKKPPCGAGTLNSNTTFDTKACKLISSGAPACQGTNAMPPMGPSTCYFYFENLTISGTVEVSGTRPLILLVKKMATISGVLFAGAKGHEQGPGGHAGGKANLKGDGPGGGEVCSCTDKTSDDCGGGGGGHAKEGGPGSQEGVTCLSAGTVDSSGGSINGKASLSPLQGGSGGAGGHNSDTYGSPGLGGGGGGAVQISAQISITISGTITAGGGGGQVAISGSYPRSGGGGGSGGAVLLEAPVISGGGFVAVNGGGGAAGAINTICQSGEDAHPNNVPAKGGNDVSGSCVGGGGGAVGTGKGGGAAVLTGKVGAGGGGGVGWIRFNWSTSKPTVSHSGMSSLGTLVQIQTP